MDEIIKALKKHALDRYEDGTGWDILIECYTNAEIMEELIGAGVKTVRRAIKHFEDKLGMVAAIQNEQRPMAGWDY